MSKVTLFIANRLFCCCTLQESNGINTEKYKAYKVEIKIYFLRAVLHFEIIFRNVNFALKVCKMRTNHHYRPLQFEVVSCVLTLGRDLGVVGSVSASAEHIFL